MSRFKTIIKDVLVALGALLVCMAVGLAMIIAWPALLLNQQTVSLVPSLAKTAGIDLHWQNPRIQLSSPAFTTKTVAFSAQDFCIKAPAFRLDACFSRFSFNAVVSFKGGHFHVDELGPADIMAQHIAYKPAPSPEKKQEFKWPRWLEGTRLQPLTLSFPNLDVRLGDQTIKGALTLSAKAANTTLEPTNIVDLALNGTSLCVATAENAAKAPVQLNGCFSEVALSARVSLAPLRVLRVGPSTVRSRHFAVRLAPETARPKPAQTLAGASSTRSGQSSPPPSNGIDLPAIIRGVQVAPLNVTIDDFSADGLAGSKLHGNIQLNAQSQPNNQNVKIRLNAEQVCIHPSGTFSRSKLPLSGCFDSLLLGTALGLDGPRLDVLEIGPINAKGGDVTLKPLPKAATARRPQAASSVSQGSGLLPAWLEQVHLEPVHVAIDHWRYEGGKSTYAGRFTLDAKAQPGRTANALRWLATLSAKPAGDSAQDFKEAHATLSFVSPRSLARASFTGPWQGEVTAAAALAKGRLLNLTGRIGPSGKDRFLYNLRGTLLEQKQQRIVSAWTNGAVTHNGVEGQINADIRKLPAYLRTVSLDQCGYRVGWHTPRQQNSMRFNGQCLVKLGIGTLPFKRPPPVTLPRDVAIQLKANLQAPVKGQGPIDGLVTATVVPISTPEFDLTADVRASLGGSTDDLPQSLSLEVATNEALHVAHFQALVKALSDSPYPIPAPLNVLEGTVDISSHGHGNLTRSQVIIPLTVQTNLASAQQKVDVTGTGQLLIGLNGQKATSNIKPQLTMNIALNDVQLVLPQITLAGKMPQIMPDSRFVSLTKAVQKQAKPPVFVYHITVQTPRVGAVRLLSNLAKQPVPLGLDFALNSGQPLHGEVQFADFKLNLFKRDAKIDQFRVAVSPDTPSPELNGRLSVDYNVYKITILVLGTMNQPAIHLYSEPPLSDRDMVAVLLFGQPLSDLQPEQAQSAESMSAALADSALNLASLYLLASTPVQSVGYNPQSGVFSAQVKLAPGTNLTVGTNWEDYQRLGLHRRLGRYWSVETYVETDRVTGEKSATAFLQWSNRY